MIKGFKVRIYPTKEQEEMLWKHINCCRFIWNYMLELQIALYKSKGIHLSCYETINLLTNARIKYPWLCEVSRYSLGTICRDLDKSYTRFFKDYKNGVGHPRFKSKKKSKQTYPVRYDELYFTKKGNAHIEKVGKVKYKYDYKFPHGKVIKYMNPRISYVNNKWILSFSVECENQTRERLNDYSLGIDLGIRKLAVVSSDSNAVNLKFDNINKSKHMRYLNRKLKHIQRTLSRKIECAPRINGKYVQSNNIIKTIKKLRKTHARISNIRHNYIHQCTHKIVSYNPKMIIMEDLNVSGMMKNKHLSRHISEMCWCMFKYQIIYKCEWKGIEYTEVPRIYPSSKTCSTCGYINKDLGTNETYICPKCGMTIDRDLNAAINLSRYKV